MVRPRLLICALLAALLLAGCSTPTTPTPPPAAVPGHQDPEIWRPQNPVYPMPQ